MTFTPAAGPMDGQRPPSIVVPPPGPASCELAARLGAVECPAFDARRARRGSLSGAAQTPIVYADGLGCNVTDVDGNRYVDLAAGFGALALGHRAPGVSRAVGAQSERLWLALGDVYGATAKLHLIERLVALFPEPGARVLLGMSGADAVTAALKTAVLATGKPGVVAFRGAYHGLSHGPLAACGLHEDFRAPFAAQLGDYVQFTSYPEDDTSLARSLEEVRDLLGRGEVGAVLVEPILGRGGCIVPPPAFLPGVRALCDRASALLVADEIWTGLGRSGAMLASVEAGVLPDVICLGKALGAGLPVAACIGRASVMEAWGAHGGAAIHTATHFGAPLACAAALGALDALEGGALVARAHEVGVRLIGLLRERTRGLGVRCVRGRGLMIGVGLEGGAACALRVSRALLARGYIVLTGGVDGDVLTLTPPLTIEPSLLSGFVEALVAVLGGQQV